MILNLFILIVYKLRWLFAAIAIALVGFMLFGMFSLLSAFLPGIGIVLMIVAILMFLDK